MIGRTRLLEQIVRPSVVKDARDDEPAVAAWREQLPVSGGSLCGEIVRRRAGGNCEGVACCEGAGVSSHERLGSMGPRDVCREGPCLGEEPEDIHGVYPEKPRECPPARTEKGAKGKGGKRGRAALEERESRVPEIRGARARPRARDTKAGATIVGVSAASVLIEPFPARPERGTPMMLELSARVIPMWMPPRR